MAKLHEITISSKYYSNKYYIIQINLKTDIIIKIIHHKITSNTNTNKAKILSYKQRECRKKKEEIRYAQILTKMKGEKFSNRQDGQNVNEEI